MAEFWKDLFRRPSTARYSRKPPLVLINGLADQPESWFANLDCWRKHFDVHTPALLAYEGPVLQQRIDAGLPISVDFLVERLRAYLDLFAQSGPYHVLANSMGGKVAVEFAIRYPEYVNRLVLLCPSGLAHEERLPLIEGVRRCDMHSVVHSVFFDARRAPSRLAEYYQQAIQNKRWRSGLLRTVRGTMEHSVRTRLGEVTQPTLLVVGEHDRIVDPQQSLEAGQKLKNGRLVVLPRCGHAPQIEQAQTVNRLVVDFLKSPLVSS